MNEEEYINCLLDYANRNSLSGYEIKKLFEKVNKPAPKSPNSQYKSKFHKFIFEYQILLFIIGSNIIIGLVVYLCTL